MHHRVCLTSMSSRFKIGDLVKFARQHSSFYGVVVEIVDYSPYSFSYIVRWMNNKDRTYEELDGVWLEEV